MLNSNFNLLIFKGTYSIQSWICIYRCEQSSIKKYQSLKSVFLFYIQPRQKRLGYKHPEAASCKPIYTGIHLGRTICVSKEAIERLPLSNPGGCGKEREVQGMNEGTNK
ncbi:Hypothetical_protein [Hexamita inflata]|uniref:Hypothetical_protein n=1 Tax=Hexamita inflata TaxID=28002 RepID=A0AA86NQ96_9EUKA|nr:Hypothetical protein HINF_LOCUS10526 [Hexamita inflata]